MRKLRIFVVEGALLPILLAWLFLKYPDIFDAVIPWIALCVMWHLTWEFVLDTEWARAKSGAALRKVGRMIWVYAFIVGGLVSIAYFGSIKFGMNELAKHHKPAIQPLITLADSHDNTFNDNAVLGGGLELKNSNKNTFNRSIFSSAPPTPASYADIDEWRRNVTRDAGDPAKVKADFDWMRQKLEVTWSLLSPAERDVSVNKFDKIEGDVMRVAADKQQVLLILPHIIPRTIRPPAKP
jgi:hypothetical protein